MLRLRFRTDCTPRTNSGHPPHSTTGVANPSSIHIRACVRDARGFPGRYIPIATTTSGTLRIRLAQNRRDMLRSSAFPASSSGCMGSSAIPQMGQSPGPSRMTCGCMGQVHLPLRLTGTAGSSAMPHFGHAPGYSWRTSGCIGQVWTAAAGTGGRAALPYLLGSAANLVRQCALQK